MEAWRVGAVQQSFIHPLFQQTHIFKIQEHKLRNIEGCSYGRVQEKGVFMVENVIIFNKADGVCGAINCGVAAGGFWLF